MTKILSFLFALLVFINPLRVNADEIILAGGCFWCLEHDLESLEGINSVKSGYSGGDLQYPNYYNHDGHQEVVLVDYNSKLIDLDKIFRVYIRNIDPLDGDGQFCDRGESYRPVIFFQNPVEDNLSKNALILASNELNVLPEQIEIELKSKSKFWLAEDYHQDYAKKNELKYKFYRFTCGRDQRLEQLWGERARSGDPWIE